MAFTPLLPPSSIKPRSAGHLPQLTELAYAIRLNFNLSTLLLFGAAIQTLLTFIVPSYYACLPVFAILLGRLCYTLAITYNLLPNPYLKDSIHDRSSAQVPDLDGNFSDKGSAEGVVCFHLGAKMNHPLGFFSLNAEKLGKYADAMYADLEEHKATNGFLGGSTYYQTDDRGAVETAFISYWRSIEDIHNFAYSSAHRKGWEWWNSVPKEYTKHLGINHEIFAAAPGQWEAVYLNHQPTLLGGTTFLQKGDKQMGGQVDDMWVGSLMDASKGKLKGSAGRLGWQPTHLYEKHQYQGLDEKNQYGGEEEYSKA